MDLVSQAAREASDSEEVHIHDQEDTHLHCVLLKVDVLRAAHYTRGWLLSDSMYTSHGITSREYWSTPDSNAGCRPMHVWYLRGLRQGRSILLAEVVVHKVCSGGTNLPCQISLESSASNLCHCSCRVFIYVAEISS